MIWPGANCWLKRTISRPLAPTVSPPPQSQNNCWASAGKGSSMAITATIAVVRRWGTGRACMIGFQSTTNRSRLALAVGRCVNGGGRQIALPSIAGLECGQTVTPWPKANVVRLSGQRQVATAEAPGLNFALEANPRAAHGAAGRRRLAVPRPDATPSASQSGAARSAMAMRRQSRFGRSQPCELAASCAAPAAAGSTVHLNRPIPAIDHQHRTRDVGRQIACQEDRRADDVLRLARPTEGRVLEEDPDKLGIVGADLCIEGGFDQARTDRIDAHAIPAELGSQRPGKAQQAGLGGGICRRIWRAHVHEGLDRADIDDPPLTAPKLLKKCVRDVEDTIEVDGHDVLPVLNDRRRLGAKGVAAIDPGIVHQDRDLAAALRDLGSQPPASVVVGNIEPEA